MQIDKSYLPLHFYFYFLFFLALATFLLLILYNLMAINVTKNEAQGRKILDIIKQKG